MSTTELVTEALDHVRSIPASDLATQSKRQAAEKLLERVLEETRQETERTRAEQRPITQELNLVGEAGPELDVDDDGEAGTVTG